MIVHVIKFSNDNNSVEITGEKKYGVVRAYSRHDGSRTVDNTSPEIQHNSAFLLG
jgi:hypothetical protein